MAETIKAVRHGEHNYRVHFYEGAPIMVQVEQAYVVVVGAKPNLKFRLLWQKRHRFDKPPTKGVVAAVIAAAKGEAS
jgi:hypothetical protein